MESTRSRLAALLVLAVLPPVLEATVLQAISFHAARGLAPQVTAVWPYDSYHDLRWLLAYHNSWAAFLFGLLALVGIRGLLTAGLTALAWPATVDRPSFRWLVMRNLKVAAFAAVIISPWAALSLAFSAVALSWYLLASVVPMLVLAPFLQRAGVVAGWWRGLPSIEMVGWSLLNFAVLTLAGAVIASTPGWWTLPVNGLAGVANGLLWRQTVAAAVLPARIHWPRVPVAPLAIVLTMVAAVGAQALIGIAAGGQGEQRPPIISERLPDRVPYAVIVIAGHDSSWNGRPAADPRVERFSYQGLDGQGRPLPYRPQATHRSMDSSAVLLAAHVDALHRRTGRPVALLGQSEGAMVARTYLEKWPHTSVTAAMMFSPLVRPGRAYYPPPGHQGWGVVAGWELRGIFALGNLPKKVKSHPDEPFVRSVLVDAPFYRNRTLCPVAGVRMIAFLPTVSAAEAPPGEYARIPVFQLPALHGGLLGRRAAEVRVVDFLAGDKIDQPRREYDLFQRLGAAWQPPPLALSLNPVWSATREADPAFTGRICEAR
ncbi:hypothetical protein [Micromonospora sp. RTP1Z1]|uniref:hypothetical protein n=1 Tax=Micromonospora sp. RTP1Z1 TaxID=2994043 RepID=UPI0029C7EC96|nr:hypothetical protein [Micromonospora sp. RTP1Z1]